MSVSDKKLDPEIVHEGRMAINRDLLEDGLKRENFANDEDYKRALIDEYLKGRETEYQLRVQNEAMNAYNVSYYVNKCNGKRVENTMAWKGYPKVKLEGEYLHPGCYSKTPEISKKTDKNVTKGHCCAISTTSFTDYLSEKMGYKDFIVPRSRLVTDPKTKKVNITSMNNCLAADNIHKMVSIPPEYTQYKPKDENDKRITLSSAIQKGLIGIGDEFSIKIKDADPRNGTTGCHAMFVVDIKRDSKGKVISYTLGGNNPPTLEVVTEDKFLTHCYGKKTVVSVVNTNKWIKDKDKEKVKKMSIEELENLVISQKKNLKSVIDDLKKTETNYIKVEGYNANGGLGRPYGYYKYYKNKTKEYRDIVEKNKRNKDEIKASGDIVDENDKKTTNLPYTKEERRDVEEAMEKQAINAEDKLKNNEKSIENGTYGKDEQKLGEAVDKSVKEEVVKESIPTPQTKEKSIDKIKTKEDIKKETKMHKWFVNRNIKLDTKLIDTMIEKYGIDIAYDLALKSMMEPAKLMKNTDGKWRNSRKSICYFIDEDVSDEKIAKITGRSLDEVKALKPTKENNETGIKEQKDTEVNLNLLQARLNQR